MRLFQLLVLPFLSLMFAVSVRNLLKRRSRPVVAVSWTLLWVASGVAVALPDSTTRLARLLGINRGADLLTYSWVLASIVGFYIVSLRLRRMSREITVLTRELALLDAERKQDLPPGPPA